MADKKIGEVYVEIEARLDRLERSLNSAEKKVERSAKKMDKAVEKVGEQGFGKFEKGVGKAAAGIGVISQTAGLLADTISISTDAMDLFSSNAADADAAFASIEQKVQRLPLGLSELVRLGGEIENLFSGTRDRERAIEQIGINTEKKLTDAKEIDRVNKAVESLQKIARRELAIFRSTEREKIALKATFAREDAENKFRAIGLLDFQFLGSGDPRARRFRGAFQDITDVIDARERQQLERLQERERRQVTTAILRQMGNQGPTVDSFATAAGQFRVVQGGQSAGQLKVQMELTKQTRSLSSIEAQVDAIRQAFDSLGTVGVIPFN